MDDTDPSREDTGQQKIRVFLLEDHEVMRQGLSMVLSAEPDIEVVGCPRCARKWPSSMCACPTATASPRAAR
jgi:DNA-binding NarL/FixJ family response regulator